MTTQSPALASSLVDEYFERINALGNSAVLETGRLLKEFKDKTVHGDWLPLLKKLGWSEDTAERFLRAYCVFGDANLPNSANLRNLSQSAVFILAAPSTPKNVRDRIVERAQSEKVSYTEVRAAVNEAKPRTARPPREAILTQDEDGKLVFERIPRDDFAVYDTDRSEVIGYAMKNADGAIDIYLETTYNGPWREPELRLALVPAGATFSG